PESIPLQVRTMSELVTTLAGGRMRRSGGTVSILSTIVCSGSTLPSRSVALYSTKCRPSWSLKVAWLPRVAAQEPLSTRTLTEATPSSGSWLERFTTTFVMYQLSAPNSPDTVAVVVGGVLSARTVRVVRFVTPCPSMTSSAIENVSLDTYE